jgi:AcrR family transcriptional regulator
MGRPRSVSDDEILAATMTAIGRHGPARLTLANVAQEIGLSPAALVQRFGSKAGLLRAAAARGADQAGAIFDRSRADIGSPVEALLVAMATFAGSVTTREELANHIAMLQLDLTQPELREQAVAQARLLRGRIARLLVEANAAGELDVDDPATLADTVYTIYNGALITWAIDGSGSLTDWIRGRIRSVLAPYGVGPVT